MPDELSNLQSQDMSKIGFMQDILHGVKKILDADSGKAAEPPSVAVTTAVPGVESLIKRVFMFLEDGDFEQADEYSERVLDADPENARAYIGKLCAELKIRQEEDLKTSFEHPSLLNHNNYKKALRFADSDYRAKLEGYEQAIQERRQIEQERIEVEERAKRIAAEKQNHYTKNGFLAVGNGVNYAEYTIQKDSSVIQRNGMPFNGYVKIERLDGSTYEGHFNDGLYNGHGIFRKNSIVYKGEFKDGRYSGQGTFSKDNIVYQGEFLEGKKHGHGTFTDYSGMCFDVFFTNGSIDSQKDVTITFSNGDTFNGKLFEYEPPKFGKMNGTMSYSDGSIYTGDMVDLQPHGKGELVVAGEKEKYKGTWSDGALCIFRPGVFIRALITVIIALPLVIIIVGLFAPWFLGFDPLETIIVLTCIVVWFLYDLRKEYMRGYCQRKAGG